MADEKADAHPLLHYFTGIVRHLIAEFAG